MGLTDLADDALRVKFFPPRRLGVILPIQDRRTAALGIVLFTASRRSMLAIQEIAFRMAKVGALRLVPGRVGDWTPPTDPETWMTLVEAWTAVVGPVNGIAVYQRRQASRTGLTALLTRAGRACAVAKVREGSQSLRREHDALTAVHAAEPKTFRAPVPLGLGQVGDLGWSLQEAMFARPHLPGFDPPARLFDEVASALRDVVRPAGDLVASHGDLTPWNLRRDRKGRLYLYDWEDVVAAPPGSDRAYFDATSYSLGAIPMPTNVPAAAAEFWRSIVCARRVENAQDAALTDRLLAALGPEL